MCVDLQNANLRFVCKSSTYTGGNDQQYPQYELDKDTSLTLLLDYEAENAAPRWSKKLECVGPSHGHNLEKPSVVSFESTTRAAGGGRGQRVVTRRFDGQDKNKQALFRGLFCWSLRLGRVGSFEAWLGVVGSESIQILQRDWDHLKQSRSHFVGYLVSIL